MDKQEAIDYIKNIDTLNINDKVVGQQVDMVIKNQVLDIICQIDQPQKVVIPKFVAEWIEYCKANGITLLGAIDPVSKIGEALANSFSGSVMKCTVWATRNPETFARAWLDGYTIEQEQLYTVEIPNPNTSRWHSTVLKRKEDGTIELCVFVRPGLSKSEFKLTEAEIKQDFKWAWDAGFAKEVE